MDDVAMKTESWNKPVLQNYRIDQSNLQFIIIRISYKSRLSIRARRCLVTNAFILLKIDSFEND